MCTLGVVGLVVDGLVDSATVPQHAHISQLNNIVHHVRIKVFSCDVLHVSLATIMTVKEQ